MRGWGAGVLDRRDVLDIMHDRSRMTIRLSHPYNPGTEPVVLSPTRREAFLAPSAERREVSAESHEGWGGRSHSLLPLVVRPE